MEFVTKFPCLLGHPVFTMDQNSEQVKELLLQ